MLGAEVGKGGGRRKHKGNTILPSKALTQSAQADRHASVHSPGSNQELKSRPCHMVNRKVLDVRMGKFVKYF